ncbi:MAG TPA: aldehyde dehydrogenase family protein [Baekduia sp.]
MATTAAHATVGIEDFPTGLLIDGEWSSSSDGSTIDNINPATEEVLATVDAASAADVDRAVRAARTAFEGPWRAVSGRDRGRLLNRLAALVERDAAHFHAIKGLENGMPAGGPDVPMTIDVLEYFAGWADKIHGRVIPTAGAMDPSAAEGARPEPLPSHVFTVREPIGVIGAICAWNAPLLTAAIKLAPMLAAGNTVVFKTSEESMQAILYLGKLVEEAGFPAGVVNIINGRGPVTGAALVEHPDVDHISFTGSPEVGATIAQAAARTYKRVTLELGGKNPQLIFADADLDKAAFSAAIGVIANAGQVCLSGSRILVERSVYDEVVERVAAIAGGVTVGDPFDPGVMMGSLINARQLDRVLGYIEQGRNEGARLVVGGERLDRPGYFVQPTFFADAHNDMTIAREEIFGPVGTIIPFDTEDEAVRIANDTEFGLGATVWTRDVSRAHLLPRVLHAGAVSVNSWSPLDARVPHGGFGRSGQGRENGYAAIEDVTEEKTITIVL